ncbi:MAG: hypothetical protein ABSD74_02680 [Rhizomicrobium sp.]
MKLKTTKALIGAVCLVVCASQADAGIKFKTRLFLSANGMALSSFPSTQVLSQTITVTRTQGTTQVNWKAKSDASWLTVTASGVTGGTLQVTANPASLTPNQSYVAKVNISTQGGDFKDKEILYVGMWVGSTDPSTVEVSLNGGGVAANPVTPIAYASSGSSIYAYNVYSGSLVNTFSNVGTTLGQLQVSSDGNTLFAVDTTGRDVVALDAASGKQLGVYPGSAEYGVTSIVYARPFGQPSLYIGSGTIVAVPKGQVLSGNLPAETLAVTPDGQHLYAVDPGISPGTLSNYSVSLSKKQLAVTSITSTDIGSNCQALAVSFDAAHVYPACGSPYQFDVYDGQTLQQVQTLAASSYPNNAAIDENGDFVGGLNGLYQPYDTYVYDQSGNLVSEIAPADGLMNNAEMTVSGDGTRVISLNGSNLVFRSL